MIQPQLATGNSAQQCRHQGGIFHLLASSCFSPSCGLDTLEHSMKSAFVGQLFIIRKELFWTHGARRPVSGCCSNPGLPSRGLRETPYHTILNLSVLCYVLLYARLLCSSPLLYSTLLNSTVLYSAKERMRVCSAF